MYKVRHIWKSIATAISPVYIRRNITSQYPTVHIEQQNFTNFILNKMKDNPNCIALIDGLTGTKYCYKDLYSRIQSIASAMTTRGLKKGDKVGMVATNSVDYMSVYMATIGCGATVVSFNPSYTNYELEPLMRLTRPKFLFSNSVPLKMILSSSSMPSFEKIFSMDPDPIPGTSFVKCLLEEGDGHSPVNDESYKKPDDISLIIFSSGTTGQPKGVPITNTNLIAAANIIHSSYVPQENCTFMGCLPMFHIFGVLVSFILAIVTSSVSVILPSFSPVTFLQAIEKYKITHLHVVPPILQFLLNHPDVNKHDLSSISRMTSGAAPLERKIEEQVWKFFLQKNPKFVFEQGYGLSETSGIISLRVLIQEISKNKMGSVGLLLGNQEMKFLSTETGEEVGPNTPGEILIKGPNVIRGYLGTSEAEQSKSFEHGWFKTGDLGYYDDDQYIFVIDRIKELIKVKGHQVAPAELEGLLMTHPSVADCAVIGVFDDAFGEVPRAFVVKKRDVTEAEIENFVEKNLSSHKHLRGGVRFVDSIPKNASGKILRKLLK